MWLVPNQLNKDIITDEDERLQKVVDNLMIWGDFGTIRAWKNRAWNSLFQIKADSDAFTSEYVLDIESFLTHELRDIEEEVKDLYSDLPFLAKAPQEGHYLFVSGWLWEEELQVETARFSSVLPKNINYWATPLARDHFDYKMNKPLPRNAKMEWTVEQRARSTMPGTLFWVSDGYKTHCPNTQWLDTVMGLPPGWTLLVDEI